MDCAVSRYCSAPLQRRGVSADDKKDPASEEAGYSKSPSLLFILKTAGPSCIGASKMPPLSARDARNVAQSGSIIGSPASLIEREQETRDARTHTMAGDGGSGVDGIRTEQSGSGKKWDHEGLRHEQPGR